MYQKLFEHCVLSIVTFFGTLSYSQTRFHPVGRKSGEYIVKLKHRPSIFSFDQSGFLGKEKISLKRALSSKQKIYLVKSHDGTSLSKDDQTIRELQKNSDVDYIEPNYVYSISFGSRKPKPGPPPPFLPIPDEDKEPAPAPPLPPASTEPDPRPPVNDPNALLPDDPQLGNQWALHNTSGASIKASYAWNVETGSRDIVVAVVDTGVDYSHKDLKANIWSKSLNGSLIKGFNAITKSYDPMDDHSHGTHVAGVIGAATDNRIGMAGVNWNVRILPIKFLNSEGSGSTADAIAGIDWAVDQGVDVMNMSWGGGDYSQALLESLQRAEQEGVVLVAAAGNEHADNDTIAAYPANYDVPGLMSVAASGAKDQLAAFSNYGKNEVHLMAPGMSILSTVPGHSYAVYSGTSMAAPYVAGAAALLLSRNPQLTPSQVKDIILATVDKVAAAKDFIQSGGRLNLDSMIRY